jgi:hypothetical protein
MYRVRQEDLPFKGSSHQFVGADHGDVQVSVFLLRALPGDGPGPHRHGAGRAAGARVVGLTTSYLALDLPDTEAIIPDFTSIHVHPDHDGLALTVRNPLRKL